MARRPPAPRNPPANPIQISSTQRQPRKPRPSEKVVALSLVDEWYDIDPDSKGLDDVEERLRVLAGAGMVAIKVWVDEFAETPEGDEPTSEERAQRRAELMGRQTVSDYVAAGKRAFSDYAEEFRRDSQTRILLDQHGKLDRRIERLTDRAQDELSRLVEALELSRDALNDALPGTEGATLTEKIGKLSETITTLETLVRGKHGQKVGLSWLWHKVLEVLWEAAKIIIGIFLAGVILYVARLPFIGKTLKAGGDLLEHESSAASPALPSHQAAPPPVAAPGGYQPPKANPTPTPPPASLPAAPAQ